MLRDLVHEPHPVARSFRAKGSLFLSPPTTTELASTGWDYKMPIAWARTGWRHLPGKRRGGPWNVWGEGGGRRNGGSTSPRPGRRHRPEDATTGAAGLNPSDFCPKITLRHPSPIAC